MRRKKSVTHWYNLFFCQRFVLFFMSCVTTVDILDKKYLEIHTETFGTKWKMKIYVLLWQLLLFSQKLPEIFPKKEASQLPFIYSTHSNIQIESSGLHEPNLYRKNRIRARLKWHFTICTSYTSTNRTTSIINNKVPDACLLEAQINIQPADV